MIPIRDSTPARWFAPVTLLLIIANVMVFWEQATSGQALFDLYRISPADIAAFLTRDQGTTSSLMGKIFVSGFMHGGFFHLFGNLLFLGVFGPAIEKRLGIFRFLLLYTGAIYLSFATHALIHPHSPVAVIGASGAIAAVMGAYLILYPRARIATLIPLFVFIRVVEIPSLVFMLGWFALQAVNGWLNLDAQAGVAWWSHIGGFLLGAICGIHFRWFR